MDAKELLSTYYGRLAEHRYAEAAAMFRDDGDVLWSIPGEGPLAGRHESKGAIEKALQTFADGRIGEVKRPIHAYCVADDGEHVCVQYLLHLQREGKTCGIVAIDAWHIHDGALAEVWTFFETLYEFDAWTRADRQP